MKIKAKENCRWDLVSLGEVMLRLDPGDMRISTAREFRVWEGGGESRHRLGVVLGPEVTPHRRTLGLAVAARQRRVEEGAVDLVAATDREDRLHQGGDGDDVGRRPGRRHLLQRRVLGRQLGRVDERGLDVGVDAVAVGQAVGLHLLAVGARRRTGVGATSR